MECMGDKNNCIKVDDWIFRTEQVLQQINLQHLQM